MAPATDYRLRLATLSEGLHVRHFTCGTDFFASMECDDITAAGLDVELSIDVRHENYAMTFRITGEVSTPCDRCLDPLHLDLDEEYDLTVRYGEDYDDTTDGVLVIPESETTFDVASIIRDTVLLALPIRRVHPDGECNPGAEQVLRDHAATMAEDEEENPTEE